MDDTQNRNDRAIEATDEGAEEHPAEVLAALDPADAPDVAEELADRLAEELEQPEAGVSGAGRDDGGPADGDRLRTEAE
jgi:hypothetical protein